MGFDRAAWRGLTRCWAGLLSGLRALWSSLAAGGKKALSAAPKPCGSRERFWYVESEY